MEPSDSSWVPPLLFALLGVFFLQKAVRPGAKQSWAWGRGGGPVPISRPGHACLGATFLAIAAVVSNAPEVSTVAVAAFFVCFLATLVMGFLDTHRYRRASKRDGRQPDERAEDARPADGSSRAVTLPRLQ